MENEGTGQVNLHRIDAAQNMRRFYTLTIQPTLFGGASIIRNWGRIGSNGQTMMETFDGQEGVRTRAGRNRTLRSNKSGTMP